MEASPAPHTPKTTEFVAVKAELLVLWYSLPQRAHCPKHCNQNGWRVNPLPLSRFLLYACTARSQFSQLYGLGFVAYPLRDK